MRNTYFATLNDHSLDDISVEHLYTGHFRITSKVWGIRPWDIPDDNGLKIQQGNGQELSLSAEDLIHFTQQSINRGYGPLKLSGFKNWLTNPVSQASGPALEKAPVQAGGLFQIPEKYEAQKKSFVFYEAFGETSAKHFEIEDRFAVAIGGNGNDAFFVAPSNRGTSYYYLAGNGGEKDQAIIKFNANQLIKQSLGSDRSVYTSKPGYGHDVTIDVTAEHVWFVPENTLGLLHLESGA